MRENHAGDLVELLSSVTGMHSECVSALMPLTETATGQ